MEINVSTSLKPFAIATCFTFTMALTIGTGGIYTYDNLRNISQWYDYDTFESVDNMLSNAQFFSPAEKISSLRDILQLNMSELASLLHVSRPTAYGWLNGKEPNVEAQKNINYLSNIADKVKDLDIGRMDLLIHRPIFNNSSLLDQIIAQEDVTESLKILKGISTKEFTKRQNNFNENIVPLNDAAHYNSTPLYRM